MEKNQYQKGKFYSLPILSIVEDGGNTYFQVKANERVYLIRMFDFQQNDPEMRQMKELPCMVKDIHGDNIVFVQNFARMFGKDYKEDEQYPFTVQNQGMTQVDGQFFYNVRDNRGVIFKLTTPPGVHLMPQQRIYCKIKRITPDRLSLEYCHESKAPQSKCITLDELLASCGTEATLGKKISHIFRNDPIFSEAREQLKAQDNQWIIKVLLAVPDYWTNDTLPTRMIKELTGEYIRICLFLLEESNLLQSFPESERENYQEWIAKKILNAEIFSEVLEMEEANHLEDEVESILHKIRNSGFIYRPDHKIAILIMIFSIRPTLLEQRIDNILDIIEATNWSRRNAEFRKAFCLFMTYYIDTNRDLANRTALVNDETSNRLLGRMVRAISYLLLMTDNSIDLPLYRSMLYHYLSYVRYNTSIGVHRRGIVPSESLIERAFQALMAADSGAMDLNWNSDIKQSEIFAYKMAVHPFTTNMLTTKSLESDTVRFTVNNNRITIAPSISKDTDHNVLPKGMLDWHDIQIYLPNSGKYGIAKNASISKWKEWWHKIDIALFSKETKPIAIRPRKLMPEVGQTVMIRVLSKDESNPLKQFRYYCRIEDTGYYGEGWIDIYGSKASTGLFRYNPLFDIDSFYLDGEALLIEARINSVVSGNPECPTFIFDAMGKLDEFIKDTCSHGEESDCRIIYHDDENQVMLAISEKGYGVFIPETTPDIPYSEGDTVKVRVTDASQPRKIQAEVIAPADSPVDIKRAAEELLADYCDGQTFQESDEQLAKEALSLSDDQFEPRHIQQMIAILDHKALIEEDRATAYGYLSIARILSKMTSDENALRYLDQRLRMLAILEDFGKNGRVDNEEFKRISDGNEDLIEAYPLLKEKLCQIRIVDSIGQQESNSYLWQLATTYPKGHNIGKLARLGLSYNVSDGMQLNEYRTEILEHIKRLLNIQIAVPKTYSFGEEDQLTEFKTSIVFPPEQGMKPNLEAQTLNILKVIVGMANAYGGTLYLGVYDTGTVKGLEDDLKYEYFGGSKDKYKNYLRNKIRVALGASLNASIIESHPDAGDKWVYALKIQPVKHPVGLRQGEETMYFFREGASTYRYEDIDLLQKVMDNRSFSEYDISSKDVADFSDHPAEEAASSQREDTKDYSYKTALQRKSSQREVATGRLRPNVVDNWADEYGVDTEGYIRFNDDMTWSLLDDIAWEEGWLTLALGTKEKNGSIIMVYEDGEIQRIKMAEILKAKAGVRNKMRSDRRPIFICPSNENDALLVVYNDTKGQSAMRLDNIANFKEVKITEQGQAYPDTNINEIKLCEIIPAEHHESLKPMHNMTPNSSFRTNNYYGALQLKMLESLGIRFSD